jgi:hypothetical protein
MVNENVIFQMGMSNILDKLSPQWTIAPWLTCRMYCFGPMRIVQSDAVNKFGARTREAIFSEWVTRFRIYHEKLAVSSCPNLAEQLDCQKEAIVTCRLAY